MRTMRGVIKNLEIFVPCGASVTVEAIISERYRNNPIMPAPDDQCRQGDFLQPIRNTPAGIVYFGTLHLGKKIICRKGRFQSHLDKIDFCRVEVPLVDRKSTRLNSSHVKISYAVFC